MVSAKGVVMFCDLGGNRRSHWSCARHAVVSLCPPPLSPPYPSPSLTPLPPLAPEMHPTRKQLQNVENTNENITEIWQNVGKRVGEKAKRQTDRQIERQIDDSNETEGYSQHEVLLPARRGTLDGNRRRLDVLKVQSDVRMISLCYTVYTHVVNINASQQATRPTARRLLCSSYLFIIINPSTPTVAICVQL